MSVVPDSAWPLPVPHAPLGHAEAANDSRTAFAPPLAAHEFFLEGRGERARTGVLLVHGLTGTPAEMRMLGKAIARAGFSVYGMQLAGHCGAMDDLLATRWQDWADSVHGAARRLSLGMDRIVVMGLSMGAVLALELASHPGGAADGHARPPVAGVVAISTMFRHDGWSIPFYTRLSFLLKPFRLLGIGRRRVFMEQPPYGIKDTSLRQKIVAQMQAGDSAAAGLPGNPWYSIIEMKDLSRHVRRRLQQVSAPCLVLHAAEDDISSVRNAEQVRDGVCGPVELVLLRDSYHMLTIDRERREVAARAVAFCERIAAEGGAAR